MPPRERFPLEKILETAIVILKKRGWPAVTARSIAKALDASTMPIYSAIGSMKNLEKRLKRRAYSVFAEYQARRHTENVLLNMAVGRVLFAKNEPFLYRFLHIDSPVSLSPEEQAAPTAVVSKKIGRPAAFAEYFGRLPPDAIDKVSYNAWIFTHGFAMAAMSGHLGGVDEKKIVSLLREAGEAFAAWETRKRNGRRVRNP